VGVAGDLWRPDRIFGRLALREKKIHIVGSPELKIEGTPIYIDVEGLPDRDFYYLIGMRLGSGTSAIQHSFWAKQHRGREEDLGWLSRHSRKSSESSFDPLRQLWNHDKDTFSLPTIVFIVVSFSQRCKKSSTLTGWKENHPQLKERD
jgi:hypothetical protein